MNFRNQTIKPYRKPNDNTVYINTQSNHPPCVIKQIPKSINSRLNNISSNEQIFKNSLKPYEEALKKSGHKPNFNFSQNKKSKPKNRNRSRNITWFNPPFNKNVKTNLGEEFLKLIDKNFPKNNPLNKIINRQTVKISYRCSANVGQRIQSHNRKILNEKPQDSKDKLCNCRKKDQCPVNNECLKENVVYKATVKHNKSKITYIGSTSTSFKTRYNNHKQSFNHVHKQSATTLSQYIWDKNISQKSVSWEIVVQCPPYKPGHKTCSLCVNEKLHVLLHTNDPRNLNKRTDYGNSCPHKKKCFLSNYS